MKRKGVAKPQARSFQFVSLTPELAGNDVAKADQRRLVRSNAAAFQWSRQRKGAPKSAPLEANGLTDLTTESAGETSDIASNEAGNSKKRTESESHSSLPDKSTGETSAALVVATKSSDLVTYLPSPQQYIVVSPIDQAGQQLKFNVHYIIPHLVPEIQKGIENPATALWVSLALENPSLYKTWVHCISVYYFALRGQWKQSEFLLSTHSRALEAMNGEMQDSVHACSDSNILAVWGLATHGWEKFLPPGYKVPNQGRMKHLQSLDRYSLMKFIPLHLNGLEALTQMRGGLDKVKSEGIAALISYTGIVEATKTLSHPRWPYQSLCGVFTPLEGMESSIDPNHPLANLGSGFLRAIDSTTSGPLQDLLDIIQELSLFTALLRKCDLGKNFSESLGQIADQRNLIQYRLTSLPKSTDLHLALPQAQTYEITRLALMIFSLLVIFPVTPSAAPFAQLATLLRAELQYTNIYTQSLDELNLITWAVCMGGIAAIGTPDRSWYVSTLDTIYSYCGFGDWEPVKAVLESFLWLGSTNDVDGVSLWQEVVQLRSYKRQFEARHHSELQIR